MSDLWLMVNALLVFAILAVGFWFVRPPKVYDLDEQDPDDECYKPGYIPPTEPLDGGGNVL